MITGAKAMVECLRAEGIPVVFGYPGAAIAPFYDSLSHCGIRHILTRTEQGAGHAASGWARMSGGPGVCVATSGPGATNLFTAIATAYSDSIPLVAITGQVPTALLGCDVFQEVDTTGAAEPFTKYCCLVKDAADLGRVFREAFHIASTGRRGPVLIDVPMDVQQQMVDFSYPEAVSIRGYKPRYDGHPLQIRRVAEAIREAKRPLLCLGGGIFLSQGGPESALALSGAWRIPVVSTMMGLGAVPVSHPGYYGMVGQSGSETANTAVRESDLLILIGARVGDRAIAAPRELENRTVVHIDIDSAEIGKNLGTAIPLVGDAARVIRQLLEKDRIGGWPGWTGRLDALRQAESPDRQPRTAAALDPGEFVRRLTGRLPENAVYVSDVGQNQIWSAKNYRGCGRFLTSGGMGTMGYSIPAAIGAKLAEPGRLVVAVLGDGAFQMSMNELATMLQHDIPLKIVVINNGTLGLVREIQQHSYSGNEFAVELGGGPDLGKIADAYGIPHECITLAEEAGAAIDSLLADDRPYLLECRIDPKEETI